MHSDKSAFTYHLAFKNVTDDDNHSNDVESTSDLDPVLQLQHVHVPLTVDVQQLEENAQMDSGALVVAGAGNSPAIQSHPFCYCHSALMSYHYQRLRGHSTCPSSL